MPIVKVTPKLNKVREERNLNQTQLSKLAKVNQPFISKFDKTENYSITNLISIARALGVSVEDLFNIEETDEENKKDS
ncbi:helix-turn-helix domain-containing protein [Paenibacillus odorifer]|uniref:helix-turn-helix domain-containing protein n=1 Tax=Paenibacillus odorifer TaxID=189426 RepID=UPI0009700DC7|nr:helix-turn-helix transcriptional regulator [Paenibacillus odorifer]OMD66670.1 hypothetical protein BSK50_30685 [Paenibacillus odorifer]